MSLVFDSSALLVVLRGEAGAEQVEGLLEDADVPKCIHAVNLTEVFYRVMSESDHATAQASVTALRAVGILERGDMDEALWRDAAALIADRRRERKPLALGDAFGVALARRLGADFVTADRVEIEPLHQANIMRAILIR